ncbi:MAG: hypothetical protein RLY21_2657 [Planctomycetota bacterium]|jgi:MYXO-CTERM domain-containing protein
MKHSLWAAVMSAVAASHALAGDGIQNLALGRDVSLVSGASSGVSLSTLTDGVFRPAGTHWQNGTVWWGSVTSVFEIDLGGTVEVMGAIVQADNNDTYRMWYRDLGTGNYLELWTISAVGGAGMRTRPNDGNTGQILFFDSSVFTDSIRIGAIGGDNAYSLSEVQAWGVPAPGAFALLGLAGLGAGRRRR